MTTIEKMTTKERAALNFVMSKTTAKKEIKKQEGFSSVTSNNRFFSGLVPNHIKESLFKYKGTHTIVIDEKSYLSFAISFGSKMSNQNVITFTVADYIHNN